MSDGAVAAMLGAVTRRPDLAHRDDFALGAATVRPSIRTLAGPGGEVMLEPRVMQVLVAFADAGGKVVTRDDLVRICWDGRIVGEDAVNRTIAELRRAARAADAGFSVETIPRIGYRLGSIERAVAPDTGGSAWISRRIAAGAIVAGVAATAGLGLWGWRRSTAAAAQGDELVEQARRALYAEFPDRDATTVNRLRRAVALSPGDAERWGLLAVAYREQAESAPPQDVSRTIEASEDAARRALAIDPAQSDAFTTLATLRPYFGEWAVAEDRLLRVLKHDPDNVLAINQLVQLQMGVGRVRDSAVWNDRAGRLAPNSPVPQYRRGLKLWAMGRLDDADLAIDRAMQLWPRHPGVWNARMMLFAFAGRPAAGLTLLDNVASRPATMGGPGVALWRVSLQALRARDRVAIATARAANIAAAPLSPGFANNALMTLSALGELDAAFDVAFGYFLRRGPLIASLWGGAGEMPISTLRWRRTNALFVPPSRALRTDRRFAALMEAIGLTRYWRTRGLRPDYQIGFA